MGFPISFKKQQIKIAITAVGLLTVFGGGWYLGIRAQSKHFLLYNQFLNPYLTKDLLQAKRPLVMGVLNVTPDSFSNGGKFLEPREEGASEKMAEAMLADDPATITEPMLRSFRQFARRVRRCSIAFLAFADAARSLDRSLPSSNRLVNVDRPVFGR